MHTYTLSGIQSMLGLSRSVIIGLIAAGFVTPSRGERREYRFSFQDVVLLRTAYNLQAANIPPRRILQSLRRLKASLPCELPLSGLRISAVGNRIAVRNGEQQWDAESGQLLIDFEVRPASGGNVSFLSRKASANVAPSAFAPSEAPLGCGAEDDAASWFERGVELEAGDPAEAEDAYRKAILLAPGYVDPALNLGVMLCEAGRSGEAAKVYRAALRHAPDNALLHFNLGVALEDLQQFQEAIAAYEECMRLDTAMADAHYNAALLHERLGERTKAIRHLSEYRRLKR